MIRTLTARTMEIDDTELAVQEILEQLDLKNQLLDRSVGLMSCYSEFVESGVMAAICEALPFEIIGATTCCADNDKDHDLMMLSLMVITSDELELSIAYSEPLDSDVPEKLGTFYRQTKESLKGDPNLMISYMPLLFNMGGDEIVAMLNEITGDLVHFGTVAVDHLPNYDTAWTFANGEYSKDRMAIVLLSGNIQPKFILAQLSEENVDKHKALITASRGNVVMEVNGIPVAEYMESIGVTEQGRLESVNSVPYVVDFGDGTPPLVRAIYAFSPEGYAICGGVMPVNATLSVGSIDYVDVMRTTQQALSEVLEAGPKHGVLIFSCMARRFALGVDVTAEMELINRVLPDGLPYQLAYAGGEICPVYDAAGKPHTRFHNDTLVILVL